MVIIVMFASDLIVPQHVLSTSASLDWSSPTARTLNLRLSGLVQSHSTYSQPQPHWIGPVPQHVLSTSASLDWSSPTAPTLNLRLSSRSLP
ncbi:hypothetical protein RRG08_000253 [Elysia crispata]|uniref:Uncharacterized protein n=1 Tax=Elysia crispata TaxID=231223 RepID=A0AAE0Y8K1_9GAST|nr:hypothetical protein RRG08_000253 [Elysia crispata]